MTVWELVAVMTPGDAVAIHERHFKQKKRRMRRWGVHVAGRFAEESVPDELGRACGEHRGPLPTKTPAPAPTRV